MSGQMRDGEREMEGMLPSPGLDQASESTDGATEAQAHRDGSGWRQGAWETVVGLQGVGGGPRGTGWSQCGVGRPGLPGTQGWGLAPGAPLPRLCWYAALRGSGGQGWDPSAIQSPGKPQPQPDMRSGGVESGCYPGSGGEAGPEWRRASPSHGLAASWLLWPSAETGFLSWSHLGCL